MQEFSEFVTSLGLDVANLSEQQKLNLQAAWRARIRAAESDADLHAQYVADPDSLSPADLRRLQHDRDEDRRSQRLAALRASRSGAPASTYAPPGAGSGPGGPGALLSAGLLVHMGVAPSRVADWYGERTMDAATDRRNRVSGIQDLMRRFLAANGHHAPSGKFTDSDIADTFRADRMAVGVSTVSLTGILSDAANKSLLSGWLDTPMTWNQWARVGSADNFKAATRYRMTGSGSFVQVAPGGKLNHVSLTEADADAQLATYGALIGIDRTQIINDDLSAFAAVPKVLSRFAAVKVEKVAVTKLLENSGGTTSGFFSTTHGNYQDGTDSVLTSDALGVAYQTFTEQTDSNGDPILIPPRVLAVPPALEMTALKLVNSAAVIGSTTANVPIPDGNPWAGKFKVVPIPFLADVFGITNSSDTAWYLLCEPSDYSCVEVNFLNGQQMPTVESAELDFDQLGIAMRAFHDFSANTLEYRGGVLNKGAA